MMSLLLHGLVVLMLGTQLATACVCDKGVQHLQTKICSRNGTAFIAKVEEASEFLAQHPGSRRKYTVEVIREILDSEGNLDKANINLRDNKWRVVKIETPQYEKACEVDLLEVDHRYVFDVISYNPNTKTFFTDLCSQTMVDDRESEQKLQNFLVNVENHCDNGCTVSICGTQVDRPCSRWDLKDECEFNPYVRSECSMKVSWCQKVGTKCKWMPGSADGC